MIPGILPISSSPLQLLEIGLQGPEVAHQDVTNIAIENNPVEIVSFPNENGNVQKL